jgi:hypothetical protein
MIYHTQGEHTNYYTTDAIGEYWENMHLEKKYN